MESYVAALGEIARTGASEGIRQSAIDRLIACNRCEDALVSQQKVTARAAGSFRRSMLTWTRKAQLQRAALGVDKALEWIVKDKHTGHRLAGRLGATILDRRGPMSAEVATEAVRACPLPVVVKPLGAAGSVGVFVVHADGAVLDLRKREWIGGVESLPARLAETARAEWLLEEYLAKLGDAACPAPDLKFYSFYGKVGVVLEVERYPVLRYAWWNRDGACNCSPPMTAVLAVSCRQV